MIQKIPFASQTISVWREDVQFGWVGSKARKFENWRQLALETNQPIFLFGSLHSNFLASFSNLCSKYKISNFVFAHSSDPAFQSLKSLSLQQTATELSIFPSSKLAKIALDSRWEKEPKSISIPQYGFHSRSLEGMQSLWVDLEKANPQLESTTLLLEIGSGLTFFSLLNFCIQRSKRFPKVIAILVGESLSEWESNWTKRIQSLFFNQAPVMESILEKYPTCSETGVDWIDLPKWLKGFGTFNKEYKQTAEILQTKVPFHLDLQYSGKTLAWLEQECKAGKRETEELLYIYQGGL